MFRVLVRTCAAISLPLTLIAACGVDSADVDVDDGIDIDVGDVESGVDRLADDLRDSGLESVSSALSDLDIEALAGTGDYTFFAPNDVAFRSIDADQLADLLSDFDLLEDVLSNHLVADTIEANELSDGMELEAVSGRSLVVTIDDDVSVEGVVVVETDIDAGTGVVHVVDGLILPE